MWCLEGCKGRYVYILPGCKISFGKSVNDIKIVDDATVSRFHAVVSIESPEESQLQYQCVICDTSKYGTYVLRDEERRRLSKDEKFVLKPGDKVQFGLKQSVFTVTHHPLVVLTSSLSKQEVDKLRNIIKGLGGRLCDNWSVSCTHLTVPDKFLFTTKLACALAAANTIVTIPYWEAVMKAVEETKELPNIKDFLPTVSEEWLHTQTELLLPKEERKTLFRGLFFVLFCAKQYTSYNPIITAAGGKSCVYPTKKPLTPRDLMAKNAVVIQQPANDSSQFTVQVIATDYPIIHHKLSALKRRMISDSEIPLAILHCSTVKFCNPKFHFGTLLRLNSQTFSPSDMVIIEDTQDTTSNEKRTGSRGEQQIIPETLDTQYNSEKRTQHCPINRDIPVSKGAERRSGNDERDNHPGSSKSGSDVVCTISSKNTKQLQIIPETCDSLDKSIACDSLFRSNIKDLRVIPESCDKSSVGSAENERRVKNLLQERIEIQRQEEVVSEKNKATSEKHNLTSDDLLLEDDNTTHKRHRPTLKKRNLFYRESNSLEENDSISRNEENESECWRSSNRPRIVSIEKISNGSKGVCTNQVTGKTLEKHCSATEEIPDFQLKQRDERDDKVEVIDVKRGDKWNKKDEKARRMGAREAEAEKRDENREVKRRKIGTDWYENYLGAEFTDKILRKDAPCGKKFVKASVAAPARKLGSADFVV